MNAVANARSAGKSASKLEEDRLAAAFIQNIHHFRDEALANVTAPIERVAVFDEAQRAWDVDQTSKFMQEKRGQRNFLMSEPEFLLSAMDRHKDWCAIVCLVGGGQEINTGEAGIAEWLRALQRSFPHWQVHLPQALAHDCLIREEVHRLRNCILPPRFGHFAPTVYLTSSDTCLPVTQRLPYRSNLLSETTRCLSHGICTRQGTGCVAVVAAINGSVYWHHRTQRGSSRMEFSSKPGSSLEGGFSLLPAITLVRRPGGRSNRIDVQGLELDWTCVGWDGNLLRNRVWQARRFRGTSWESINDDTRKSYLVNSYRVLLTRARQGMVIFVPPGDEEDTTRPPAAYDSIYAFLCSCGFEQL